VLEIALGSAILTKNFSRDVYHAFACMHETAAHVGDMPGMTIAAGLFSIREIPRKGNESFVGLHLLRGRTISLVAGSALRGSEGMTLGKSTRFPLVAADTAFVGRQISRCYEATDDAQG
jgi:hypothetical protein